MALPSRLRPNLRGQALAWLAQREHSRAELRQKLVRWAAARSDEADPDRPLAPPAEIDALLDSLEQAGHLSDRRFVESRVHARSARYGNRRIEYELRRHGADPDPDTLERLRTTEVERARAVWAARFGLVATTVKERGRQVRFLAGRGFSAETIAHVIAGPVAED